MLQHVIMLCYNTGGCVSADNPKDKIRISQRVKILKNGRMTLPIDIRDLAGIKNGQWVLVEYEEGQDELTIRLIRETED